MDQLELVWLGLMLALVLVLLLQIMLDWVRVRVILAVGLYKNAWLVALDGRDL